MIRDSALSASGLLVQQLGGPSVFPYQPEGLWEEISYDPNGFTAQTFLQSHGRDLYRRSLYTFWKRTIPPPSMSAFDASSREFCTVRESRTNTPLQALALMNEDLYVSAARALALRVMRAESDPEKRIAVAMQLVVGRDPKPEELQLLSASLARNQQQFAASPASADKLLSADGAASEFSREEQAAYTLVCATILNLDEAVTRQ
jgi:hypothetical protein